MKDKDICQSICCGCGACFAMCPTNAIEMVENQRGFVEPHINQEKCVDCGLCKNVCNLQTEKNEPAIVNIAKHKDREIYLASQSGGAFTAISDIVLKNGGTVYGAAMNDDYEPIHIRTMTNQERNQLRGSKYIQSRCEHVYKFIEKDLKDGLQVLFSGTPCQVDGVLKYLKAKKVDMSKFLSVDILCHGVPSVLIWRDLIKYYEHENKMKMDGIVFTDCNKEARPIYHFKFKEQLISYKLYKKFFFSNLTLRESCYKCTYATKCRIGDFTIGDAWGVKEQNPEFHNGSGVSLMMYNTSKSLQYASIIDGKMNLKKVNLDNYLQLPLRKPHKPNRPSEGFWRDYETKSTKYMINKYAKRKIVYNLGYFTKRFFKLIFKGK